MDSTTIFRAAVSTASVSLVSTDVAATERPRSQHFSEPRSESSEPAAGDAVRTELAASSEKTDAKNSSAESVLEEAQENARELEQAMNRTKVQFQVGVSEEESGLNFRVIDIETGKVLREFPADELASMLERSRNGGGILINDAV